MVGFDTNILAWRPHAAIGATAGTDAPYDGYALATGVRDELRWEAKVDDAHRLERELGHAHAQLAGRHKPLVVDAHERVVQLRQHLREEAVGGEAVRLLKRSGAHALGLAAVDVAVHRRLLTAGPAESHLVIIDRHRQDGVGPPIPPQVIQPLQLCLRRPASTAVTTTSSLLGPAPRW